MVGANGPQGVIYTKRVRFAEESFINYVAFATAIVHCELSLQAQSHTEKVKANARIFFDFFLVLLPFSLLLPFSVGLNKLKSERTGEVSPIHFYDHPLKLKEFS